MTKGPEVFTESPLYQLCSRQGVELKPLNKSITGYELKPRGASFPLKNSINCLFFDPLEKKTFIVVFWRPL